MAQVARVLFRASRSSPESRLARHRPECCFGTLWAVSAATATGDATRSGF
jgi:hypothetical protein